MQLQRAGLGMSKEKLTALVEDIKDWVSDGGIELDKPSLLKAGSIFAGLFLVISGIIGTSAIVLGGGFSYFVGSIYAIIFGLLVQASRILPVAPSCAGSDSCNSREPCAQAWA